MIACCFAGCGEGAICRVWTKTGWANVCKAHYPSIDRVPLLQSMSPRSVECREAYKRSFAYRQKHGGESPRSDIEERRRVEADLGVMRKRMAEAAGRQPGEDDDAMALGIPIDPLEQQFQSEATR